MKKLGYLLYRENTDEFLASYEVSRESCKFKWSENPGDAMRLPNENQVKFHQKKLNHHIELKIATLFDEGSRYVVEFD